MESRDAANDAMDTPNASIHVDIDASLSAAGGEQRDAERLPLLMQPPQPSCEDLLLRQTDLLQMWLPILDAHALARLSVQPPPGPHAWTCSPRCLILITNARDERLVLLPWSCLSSLYRSGGMPALATSGFGRCTAAPTSAPNARPTLLH